MANAMRPSVLVAARALAWEKKAVHAIAFFALILDIERGSLVPNFGSFLWSNY
jgi:hypothetical protein